MNRLLAAGRHHLTLVANAAAMMSSTIATAGLGFVYWWMAARFLPTESVGLASAAIATMGFLALAGDLGLGSLLMGQIPRHAGRAGGLISAAFLVATLGSAALGVLYVIVLALVPGHRMALGDSGPDALLFVVGVAITGLVLVLDQTLLGVLRGAWHLTRNTVFAATKLLLLALALWLGAQSAAALYGTWLLGNVVSLLVLCVLVMRAGENLFPRADLRLLRGLSGATLRHHALNVLSQAPGLLMPMLVTQLLSARVNAAFYAAWLMIGVAYLAPASLTTALFAIAARDPALLARRLRFTLGLSLVLSGVTVLCCWVAGRFALGLFNPVYADMATDTLVLLALAMPAVALKYHYIALKRIREEMGQALPVLGLGALLELGAATLGGAATHSLSGLAAAWMLAAYAQAIGMWPPLLRVLKSSSHEAPPTT